MSLFQRKPDVKALAAKGDIARLTCEKANRPEQVQCQIALRWMRWEINL
ncbi:MAG: hypothetical protein HPY85_17255 [Anaerolineae bacterium]|nr:hypothetical protein [Anaerolineae bacterium]